MPTKKVSIADISQDGRLMEQVVSDNKTFREFERARQMGEKYIEMEVSDETVEKGNEEGGEEPKAEEGLGEIPQGEETESQKQEEPEMEAGKDSGIEWERIEDDAGEKEPEGPGEGKDDEEGEKKEEVNKIKIPYKWYGKEYVAELTPEDITNDHQKALKFPELQQEIKRYKAIIDKYNELGLDEEKAEFFQKLMSGDQTAIQQLLKTTKIDPYELDVDQASPVEFKKKENTLKDYAKPEVVELLEDFERSYPEDAQLLAERIPSMPASLVREMSNNPKVSIAVIHDLQQDIFDDVLRGVTEEMNRDEKTAKAVMTSYGAFHHLYRQKAIELGYWKPQGEETPQAGQNPPEGVTKRRSTNVKEKLQASTTVTGARGGGREKKSFFEMSPQEQVKYLESLSVDSEEWRELNRQIDQRRK